MNENIVYFMAMACVLPATIGLYKYNRIEKKYHPFIFMMVLDVLIETIIYLSVKIPVLGRFSRFSINVYTLLNFGLFYI